MAKLSQRLYFHNLDNNEGALNFMVDMATQSESKEALFVYLFLAHQKHPISLDELDRAIEAYVRSEYNTEIDFEVSDGVDGVRELGLLIEEEGRLSVVEVNKALEEL